MRIGVVDIGTNSTRLLVADIDEGGPLPVKTGLITTRLGEGIGSSNVLLKTAMERTVKALSAFSDVLDETGAKRVVVAATSAVRDAANQAEFLSAVRDSLGWEVRVLSGTEEAEMSYQGAVRGLKNNVSKPVVIDIGGGSTELIWHGAGGLRCVSVKAGAVRMTEGGSRMADVRGLLAEPLASIKSSGFDGLIGVGGTLTTLAAIDQELGEYDPEKVHGYFLPVETVKSILRRLEGMTLEERKKIPGLQPRRADIIVAGTGIAVAVVEGLAARGITVSETDIMYGLLFREWEAAGKLS